MEAEFLDRARRGDHKSLQMLTQHFRACARADGSKPEPPDEFTVAEVGDRGVLPVDVAKPGGADRARCAREVHPATRRRTTTSTLAQRQAEGLVRMCEIALERGIDAAGARPSCRYMTHARTADDVTHPVTLGLSPG